jgi:hypothetical protein
LGVNFNPVFDKWASGDNVPRDIDVTVMDMNQPSDRLVPLSQGGLYFSVRRAVVTDDYKPYLTRTVFSGETSKPHQDEPWAMDDLEAVEETLQTVAKEVNLEQFCTSVNNGFDKVWALIDTIPVSPLLVLFGISRRDFTDMACLRLLLEERSL